MERSQEWLDALTDGKIFRDWLSLIAHFAFGTFYLIWLLVGFSAAVGLIPVLVGVPLFLFMLITVRALASIDRRLMAAILDVEAAPVAEDIDPRGANLGERLGLYLGSSVTWRSLLYLLLKFPLGLLALVAALVIPLPLLFEVVVLGPLRLDMHLITVRLQHWLAIGLFRGSNLLLPSQKDKSRARERLRISRLETVYEEEEKLKYFLDDDGEIGVYNRGL